MPKVVLIQLSSWRWAHSCSKHVEDSNKHIIEGIVRQVGHLPELVTCCFRWPNYTPHRSLTWLPGSVWKFFLLVYFCSWVEGLLVLGCWLLTAANRVYHSEICVSNPFYLSLTVSWMEVDSENYDGWLWTGRNWSRQSFYLRYQKFFGYSFNLQGTAFVLRVLRCVWCLEDGDEVILWDFSVIFKLLEAAVRRRDLYWILPPRKIQDFLSRC